METRLFTAQLYNFSGNSSGPSETGTAREGWWGSSNNNNYGIIQFTNAASILNGKGITGISFSFTSSKAGSVRNKTAYFYSSTTQTVSSGTRGSSYLNSQIGTLTQMFCNNTINVSLSASSSGTDLTLFNGLVNELSNGRGTFVIYDASASGSGEHSSNYLAWTTVTMTVTYGDVIGVPSTSASAELGNTINISIDNTMSGASYKLTYSCGTSGTETIVSATSSNYISWTIPTGLASYITSTSATCTITCETFYNSISQGTRSCTVTINIPASYKPSTPTITLNPSSGFAQSLTEIQFTISSSPSDSGAGALSYRTTFDGITYTSATFSAIPNNSGTLSIVTVVTDGRGRTNTASKDISVSSYTRPEITSFSALRCDSSGTSQTDGSYIKVSFTGTVNEGSGNYVVSYKASTTNSWTDATSASFSSSTISLSNYVLGTTFSDTVGYDIRLTISDSQSSAIQIINVGSKSVVFDVVHSNNKDGISFGQVATDTERITTAWPIYFTADALAQTKTNLGISGSGNYVSKTGDTMTGDLIIQETNNPEIRLNVNGNFLGRLRSNNYNGGGALTELAVYDGGSTSNSAYGLRVNSPASSLLASALQLVSFNSSGTASNYYSILNTGWVQFYKNTTKQGYINGSLIQTTTTTQQSSIKVVYGTAEIPSGGADCYFGITFNSVPFVFCQIYAGESTSAQYAEDYVVQVRSVTTTKFCVAIPGTSYTVYGGVQICWIAIGS